MAILEKNIYKFLQDDIHHWFNKIALILCLFEYNDLVIIFLSVRLMMMAVKQYMSLMYIVVKF